MSTNVLIIPEDFRKDQYMLKPLITAMFDYLGKPNARIEICRDPLLTGVSQAMDKERLTEILLRYRGMVDVFVLCVDRDGITSRRGRLDERESWARETYGCSLIAENAWQEIEVWVLAGHDLRTDWSWAEIRQEVDPKERYSLPFVQTRGLTETPGEGRKILAEEAARRYSRIRQLCPEDVIALESDLEAWLPRL